MSNVAIDYDKIIRKLINLTDFYVCKQSFNYSPHILYKYLVIKVTAI